MKTQNLKIEEHNLNEQIKAKENIVGKKIWPQPAKNSS